jgi:hypothetical protein
MNSVVDSYVTSANEEIRSISDRIPIWQRNSLIANWNQLGNGLTREQRTRFTALNKVDIPKDYFVNPYPTTQITFVDSIPSYAVDTRPHMNAQTLEAITNFNTLGGQSVVGMMRQDRNQTRLQTIGIPVDNNMEDTISFPQWRNLMINGTVPGIEFGSPGPDGTGTDFTPPAFSEVDNPALPGRPIIIAPPYRYEEPENPGPDPGLRPRDPEQEPTNPEPPGPDDDINLDTRLLAGILSPSTATIQQAIDQVIICNCDCWFE